MTRWSDIRINQEIKKHDAKLFVFRDPVTDSRYICREPDRLEASDYNQYLSDGSELRTQFILGFTSDWTMRGSSVEWGIEPVMQRLLEMDSWRDDSMGDSLRKERERKKEDRARMRRNDIRATAADLRKEFAKATNDVNTSSLDKIDKRRN